MKNFFTVMALFISALAYCQQKNTSDNLIKLNILVPGVEYETSTGSNTTININLGTALAINGGSGRETEWSLFPYIEPQFRYYYNFNNRIKKEKSIANNSGNFIALKATVMSGNSIISDRQFVDNTLYFIGPVWGIQRNYNSNFNFSLNIGAGYSAGNVSKAEITPTLGFNLGWLL